MDLSDEMSSLKRSVKRSQTSQKREQHREELLAKDRQLHESRKRLAYIKTIPILEKLTGTDNVLDLINSVKGLVQELDAEQGQNDNQPEANDNDSDEQSDDNDAPTDNQSTDKDDASDNQSDNDKGQSDKDPNQDLSFN